jgi:hypothetical protein
VNTLLSALNRYRNKIIILIILSIAISLTILWYSNKYSYDPTDTMILHFERNQDSYNELLSISKKYPEVLRVDTISYIPEETKIEHIIEFHKLLTKLNLSIYVRISDSIRVFGNDDKSVLNGSYIYGYMHTLVTQPKLFRRLSDIKPQDGIGYVHIKNGWYLFGYFEE